MRAVDTNVLVYADREETPQHSTALKVLGDLVTGRDPWVLPWPCIYEFLRVVTHPAVFRSPTPLAEAWNDVVALLESPSVVMVSESHRHREILGELLRTCSITGNLIQDAHIAALLIEHGVDEIITADEGFRQFPGLRVTNPFRK